MKYRSITIAFFFAMTFSGLQAQDAAMAAGGDAEGGGGSASYSVGQVNYTTVSGTNGSLAQGVQLAYEIFITTGNELEHIQLGFSAYPNPTQGQLFLEIEDFNNENLSYQIFDMQGRLLEEKLVTEGRTRIRLDRYTKSTYLLKVSDKKNIQKTFKIIKN